MTNHHRVKSQKNEGLFCSWCLLFYSFVLILIIPLHSSLAFLYVSLSSPSHSLFTPVYFHLTFLYSSTQGRRYSPIDTVTKLQAGRLNSWQRQEIHHHHHHTAFKVSGLMARPILNITTQKSL